MSRALVLFSLVAGCSSSATHGSSAPADPERERAERDDAVVHICASAPCVGSAARIQVWRDASGNVGRYVYDGDASTCSHPPRIYFDAEGAQTLAISFRPIVAGSPEDLALRAQREAETRGLTQAEQTRCPARQ